MSKWNFDFDDQALKELKKFEPPVQEKIFQFLNKLIADYPSPYTIGEALQGPLKGLWRYRVGDYRLICDIQEGELLILALKIAHRKEVYKYKIYRA